MNHIQLIMLTASFNFNWPSMVQKFLDSSKPVGQVSKQLVSFDCWLDTRKSNSDQPSASMFYYKLVMMAAMPFLCVIVSFGFWRLWWIYKKRTFIYLGKAVSTLIILLFLVHPSIV